MTTALVSSTTILPNATFYANAPIVISTTVQITSGNGILGTTTNDNACTGCYGEYKSSTTADPTPVTSNSNYGDTGSVTLTAGDWDLCFVARTKLNGATVSQWIVGVGTVAGNNGTGINFGDNAVDYVPGGFTNTDIFPLTACGIRVQPTTSTTYYLKHNVAYSAGSPVFAGTRFSARRIR